MPARLPEPCEKITWRIRADDLALLAAIHGDRNVNRVVREVIRAYCDGVRRKLSGGGGLTPP